MDQADRLRALASLSGKSRVPRIISVTSGKGGVGKSNIAANLSVSLARRGLRVLLVDADFGLANANLILGCGVSATLDDIMFGEAHIRDAFVETSHGVTLLPSSLGIRKLLEMDLFTQRALFDRLFEVLCEYDFVIYDTAPGLSSHVLNFNATASDILVVCHPEPTAMADAYALIKVLSCERKENHFKLVVNRAQSSHEGLEVFKKLTEVADEFLNISLDYFGALPEDSCVLRAVQTGSPALVSAPNSSFSLAVERMADKLLASQVRKNISKVWDTGSSSRTHFVGGN